MMLGGATKFFQGTYPPRPPRLSGFRSMYMPSHSSYPSSLPIPKHLLEALNVLPSYSHGTLEIQISCPKITSYPNASAIVVPSLVCFGANKVDLHAQYHYLIFYLYGVQANDV